MVEPQTRLFDGRRQPFEDLRDFIERFCASAQVTDRSMQRLLLVIEELFANTVGHGYPELRGEHAEWPIWLSLSAAGDCVHVVYEDAGTAYDPFATVVEPDYSAPPESWRIGGWGIPLVTKFTQDLRYERVDGHNRISFAIAGTQDYP
jgi:anti-sigma regulatory factor (Ser/Thr protein kinase)